MNDLYDVALRDTAEGVRLFWQIKEDRKNWRESREGAYLLRTNLQAGDGRRVVVEVHAVDRGRSVFPGAEERAFDSAFVSSVGAARQGPRDGGVPRLCAVGHAETSAEAPSPRSTPKPSASGVDNAQPLSPMKAICSAVHPAKRRHRSPHHRWPRDPPAPHYRAHGGAEISAPATRDRACQSVSNTIANVV